MSVNLLWFLIVSWIFIAFVRAKTDSQDVSALNVMFTSLNSPAKLQGWKSSGGDPCGESWHGVKCKGSTVTEIQLPDLELSGSLGYQLSNLKHVTNLDVSGNNLTGNMPYQLPPNLQRLDLSENQLNGNLPYSISQMSSLQSLNLGRNQINGELTDMFQKLPKLETVDLSNNQLKGKLPQSFANLTKLRTLYLQNNKFEGSINVLRELPLDDLNVENNKFSGWIPNELKEIVNLDTAGNDWSSGAAPPPPPGVHYKRKSSSSEEEQIDGGRLAAKGVMITAISVGVLVLIFFLIALVSQRKASPTSQFIDEGGSTESPRPFTSLRSQEQSHDLRIDPCDDHKGGKSSDSNTSSMELKRAPSSRMMSVNETEFANRLNAKRSESTRTVEFDLVDLQTATANFAPGRLLGEGSIGRVYRAKYADGRVLAVKKIDSSFFESGNSVEFSSMVGKISRIRHSNIAELIGYCSEQGHNMLVYEYFRNGSLHEFLHLSDDFSKPLTWNTRIRIALGTAQAVEYLHEVCSPSLVHKNIKSSNILLDADLNPRLSDYGLADFHLHKSQDLGVGYNAPECKTPSACTQKTDVFSFGIVMLELLTGRMPYDSTKPKPEQSLVRWATTQLHDIDALAKMVDPALRGLYPPKSLSRFADIIARCVQTEPEFRPPMTEVVEELVRLVQRSSMNMKEDLSDF